MTSETGSPVDDRRTEVAGEQVLQEVQVLQPERVVEAERLALRIHQALPAHGPSAARTGSPGIRWIIRNAALTSTEHETDQTPEAAGRRTAPTVGWRGSPPRPERRSSPLTAPASGSSWGRRCPGSVRRSRPWPKIGTVELTNGTTLTCSNSARSASAHSSQPSVPAILDAFATAASYAGVLDRRRSCRRSGGVGPGQEADELAGQRDRQRDQSGVPGALTGQNDGADLGGRHRLERRPPRRARSRPSAAAPRRTASSGRGWSGSRRPGTSLVPSFVRIPPAPAFQPAASRPALAASRSWPGRLPVTVSSLQGPMPGATMLVGRLTGSAGDDLAELGQVQRLRQRLPYCEVRSRQTGLLVEPELAQRALASRWNSFWAASRCLSGPAMAAMFDLPGDQQVRRSASRWRRP